VRLRDNRDHANPQPQKSTSPAKPKRRWVRLSFALLALFIAACGPSHPPTYKVVGKVTFASGEPVTWGSVEFYSVDHKVAARGQIQPDGSFWLSTYTDNDGAVAGPQLVSIAQAALVDRPLKHEHAQPARVPPRYFDPKSSGLSFTVKADATNEFNIGVTP